MIISVFLIFILHSKSTSGYLGESLFKNMSIKNLTETNHDNKTESNKSIEQNNDDLDTDDTITETNAKSKFNV